jgi:hypothetical protein
MTATLEEAYKTIEREVGRDWDTGTFMIERGKTAESDLAWVFSVGAREYLVDGNRDFLILGGNVPVILKFTGELRWIRFNKLEEEIGQTRVVQ